jgi:serine/threonine protein phosphatase PrpC
VRLGAPLPLEQRPRATCALCLVQQGASWWAHVGDSRIYHLRGGALVGRSRDHSHVEVLLREGLITAEQAQTHPHRNYVECCLGGDPIIPDMAITRRRPLEPGDVLMVCTDGLWSGVKDAEIAAELSAPVSAGGSLSNPGGTPSSSGGTPGVALREKLLELGQRAVARNGAASDNTSAAALRWQS